MWLIIIGVIVLAAAFSPFTGLFGDTYYSPKKTEEKKEPVIMHRSFRLTKEG